eukprot:TRINITY_DN2566_c0_g1_i1.p1 TRINITY_DN2566_c0_g1~~TRINITY_DN2566_c0_g1_i1.p1  ORF type:complete len:489 (-),score=101.04 TRINITY_DN2566_c0_g1_i1:195-1472(-)
MSEDGEDNAGEARDADDVDEPNEDESDNETAKGPVKFFRPSLHPEMAVEMEFDPTAYSFMHQLQLEWPCLTLDILPDNLGAARVKMPHTMYVALGTDAARQQDNKISVCKITDISGAGGDESDDSDDESEPKLQERSVMHDGSVNRLRCCPQRGNIVASWSGSGRVHVWDLEQHLKSLETDAAMTKKKPLRPLQTFAGHQTEGFAMDWSPVVTGALLTGDCYRDIYLWQPSPAGVWMINAQPFRGHTDSVEDIQWSPQQDSVFISCGVDRTIRVWDTRTRENSKLSVVGHDADINVISWSRTVPHLLASGCDDGSFKIWDLRSFAQPASYFKYHLGPVTAIQWHPRDASMLLTAADDREIAIWDLSLEREAGEAVSAEEPDVPPQLFFVHAEKGVVKEAHWHGQIPGAVVAAGEQATVFKAANVD